MAKRIITEEEKYRNKVAKLYEAAKEKKYEYTLDDFEIMGGCWKHKDWKTWCKGLESYSETQKQFVQKYIDECKKPYGTRDLSFVHLAD